ncbi:hypothetical protein [Rhodococcus ruber]|uniref:hypothetical protein n=1 Tax=Rhodococcus ruber TaxID=1830 RepID=UPI00265FA817|nr:hypothetical protein [Rhodococcus ruber]MDO1481599.1 hypothetical protein [Rhodococcus ruber]
MADTDRTRRFRRTRPQEATEPAAYIDARAGRRGTSPQPTTAQAPRPASVQARQDVVDVAVFIRTVETERSQGRPAPRPQSMKTILGGFHGSPATQTTVQMLAAAATARHFGGEHSAAACTWEKLAQDNALRLEALRARQYRQDRSRYVQAQLPPEEIDRRIDERVAADRETDKRAFDAAGALALSYVAAGSLPSFDKLADLSREHLTADEPTVVSHGVASRIEGQTPGAQIDSVDEEAAVDAGTERGTLGSVLETAGRGIASVIGPVNGDDEVAPPLSPVDLNQLNQELLSALGAAMSAHPRSVTEMLNIERRPDHTNEVAFVPEMRIERGQDMAVGY